MTGKALNSQDNIMVDELIGLAEQEQAELIADHYSKISNMYDPLDEKEFS